MIDPADPYRSILVGMQDRAVTECEEVKAAPRRLPDSLTILEKFRNYASPARAPEAHDLLVIARRRFWTHVPRHGYRKIKGAGRASSGAALRAGV